MSELIGFGGTGAGCSVCDMSIHDAPFASDADAVAHILTHSPAEVAFALLTERATVQHFLSLGDDDLDVEQDFHELMSDVEHAATHSPARPQQG